MATATAKTTKGTSVRGRALDACADALRHMATYHLSPALERRLRRMLEAKEGLTPSERGELLVLVEMAQEKSLEKVKARVALELLTAAFPELKG